MVNDTVHDTLSNGQMKVEELPYGIFHVKFLSQQLMSSTLLRFQEYFESIEFRGKVFTLKEFIAWYVSIKGKFDYYDEWDGFNIPSEILKPFFEGKFDPLSQEEARFLEIFRDKKEKFYIICTLDDGRIETVKHEFAHALFYTNSEYRRQASEILKHYDVHDIAQYLLTKLLYHYVVLLDEVHAYILSEMEYLEEQGLDIKKYEEANRELNEVFEKYFVVDHFRKGR
jgi:hypothetical protein